MKEGKSRPKFPFKTKNCRACGIDLMHHNFFRGCTSCKKYVLCINCVTCPVGHQATKVKDLSIELFAKDTVYNKGRYNCDSCGVQKLVRPYVWRCRVCEWDVCPRHPFGVTHEWVEEVDEGAEEGGKGGLVELDEKGWIEDPFLERFVQKAKDDGVKYELDIDLPSRYKVAESK